MGSAAAAVMAKTTITRQRSSVVIPVVSSLSFVDLLKQGEWEESFSRLETDPTLAKEWHYDAIDDDGNISVYHHNHNHNHCRRSITQSYDQAGGGNGVYC